MSRSYISSPPSASWRVVGQINFFSCYQYIPNILCKIFRKLNKLQAEGNTKSAVNAGLRLYVFSDL